MRRRNTQSTFADPVLIGAVTVLIVLVAVFLAFSANQGLPFVPTKELKVDIANGSNLVAGNDVRQGGFRIGDVSALKPIELPNGQVGAQLTLHLNQANGNVPVDSTVAIRPRSVLGLKFVDLEKGTSSQLIPDGGTLPMSQTSVPVQFDDVFKTFDPRTRSAIQQNLVGFGNALAGRGSALNDTIHSLPGVLGHLEPVARYLSDPQTGLSRLFKSLNAFMGAVAPVAEVNARLFTDLATTFEAISRDTNALEATISESPSTLDVSTDSLRTQQPFLADLTTFGQALAPATSELQAALPQLNPAIEAGTKTLSRTPSLDANLQQVMNALKQLALAPGTNVAVNALTATVDTLNPMIRYLGPYVTVCDTWNYFWTFIGEHFSQHTSYGFAERAGFGQTGNSVAGTVVNDVAGTAPAWSPANGEVQTAAAPITDALTQGAPQYLHGQAYGAAVDNQGNADCETGQRGYVLKLNPFDPLHRNLAVEAHTPGDQGPTYHGLPHVPAGETFSRSPQTGPQLPNYPGNN
jgi:virulence factor Mce-like protein